MHKSGELSLLTRGIICLHEIALCRVLQGGKKRVYELVIQSELNQLESA